MVTIKTVTQTVEDALAEALTEVMQWIRNWDPNFAEDPEWIGDTKPKVEAALKRFKIEGRDPNRGGVEAAES